MSTNTGCMFLEPTPGTWYYVLEDQYWPDSDDDDDDDRDWLENATAYGPFPSQTAADDHLTANHPNPGSSTTWKYDPEDKPDHLLTRLIDNAEPVEHTTRRR